MSTLRKRALLAIKKARMGKTNEIQLGMVFEMRYFLKDRVIQFYSFPYSSLKYHCFQLSIFLIIFNSQGSKKQWIDKLLPNATGK